MSFPCILSFRQPIFNGNACSQQIRPPLRGLFRLLERHGGRSPCLCLAEVALGIAAPGTLLNTPLHRHARPVRGADHHPGGDRQRHPLGPAIGPAAPSAGGAPASEAAAQEVGADWNREDFTPIISSAPRLELKTHGPQGQDAEPFDYTPAPARLASSLAVAAEKALAVSLLVNLA